jgi:hypothetical protein
MARRQRRRRQQRRQEHVKRGGWKTRHSVITGAGIAATATLGIAGTALADSQYYYVGSNQDTTGSTDCLDPDNSTCTLRDAVDAANNNNGYLDYIIFNSHVSGAVTLSGTDIGITDAVKIYGRGADVDTVSGDGQSRIFDLNMDNTGDPVSIYGLTLTDGYSATTGGAILDQNADLLIVDSVLTGNSAGAGGAIYEAGGYAHGTRTTVAYSTIDHNLANAGGGIAGANGVGIIGGSTVAANTADDAGGAVVNFSDPYGARIFDSTISGNSGGDPSAGVLTYYGLLYSSIVANNNGAPDTYNAYLYSFASLIRNPGHDVDDGSNNLIGADPQLGPFANNGGTTPTMRPAATSPVIDQGYSTAYFDQRVSDRHVDIPSIPNAFPPPEGAADMGSVELTVQEGPQPTPSPPPPPPPPHHKKKKCKKKKHKRSAETAKKKKCKRKKKHRRSVHAGAPAIREWRAQAAAHPFEGHFGDRAWKLGR